MLSAIYSCRLLTGIQPVIFRKVVAPHGNSVVDSSFDFTGDSSGKFLALLVVVVVPILVLARLFALFVVFGIPFGLVAMGIASGSDKWESEDQHNTSTLIRVLSSSERSIANSRHHYKRRTRP